LGYGREPSHFREIRKEGLGYKKSCDLLRGLFSNENGEIQIGELINIVNESEDGLKIVMGKLGIKKSAEIKVSSSVMP
jgi:hypothetical protein